MKTIIDWFWNLSAVVNITTAGFWWFVAALAIPAVLMICFAFKKQYQVFWLCACAVYTVFAISWAMTLGWNFKENQYAKAIPADTLVVDTIDVVNSVELPETTESQIVTVENVVSIPVDSSGNYSSDTLNLKLKDNSTLQLIIK